MRGVRLSKGGGKQSLKVSEVVPFSQGPRLPGGRGKLQEKKSCLLSGLFGNKVCSAYLIQEARRETLIRLLS